MLQGVVDCAFVENGALVVLDFKTDRVPDGAALLSRYGGQLALYREALTQCLSLPVSECVLYSFHLGESFSYSGGEREKSS